MAGAKITFKVGKANVTISEFASDSDPIQVPELEVRNGEMNLNGELVTWAKPTPISFSVTLIPGSLSDKQLSAAIRSAHIGGKGENTQFDAVFVPSLVLTTPYGQAQNTLTVASRDSWTFNNGYLNAGAPGQGTNSEGKSNSKTYTFTFESVTYKSKNA